MDITNKLMEWIIKVLDWFLPTIGLSDEFLVKLDTAMSSVIGLINGAGYFIPLDVLVICLGSILAFQMAKLTWRISMWVISFARG